MRKFQNMKKCRLLLRCKSIILCICHQSETSSLVFLKTKYILHTHNKNYFIMMWKANIWRKKFLSTMSTLSFNFLLNWSYILLQTNLFFMRQSNCMKNTIINNCRISFLSSILNLYSTLLKNIRKFLIKGSLS